MPGIVAGNQVKFDSVRGRWSVTFTETKTRKLFGSEAEAIAAAKASPASTPPESGVQIINGHKVFFDAGRDSWFSNYIHSLQKNLQVLHIYLNHLSH